MLFLFVAVGAPPPYPGQWENTRLHFLPEWLGHRHRQACVWELARRYVFIRLICFIMFWVVDRIQSQSLPTRLLSVSAMIIMVIQQIRIWSAVLAKKCTINWYFYFAVFCTYWFILRVKITIDETICCGYVGICVYQLMYVNLSKLKT